MKPYDILIQPTLAAAFGALAPKPRDAIFERLVSAAATATHARRAGTIGRSSFGLHRGLHRANVGCFWIIYRVDHTHRSIALISVGERRHCESGADENRWENEGGTLRS